MCNEPPALSADDIKELVSQRLEDYKGKSLLERVALFMGKAQLLEMGLKSILNRDYDIPMEDMERWTLGRTKNELERHGIRPDFIAYLASVVRHRNHIAHDLLADHALMQSLANFSGRHVEGDLFRATYEIEQIIILYDWCEEHNGWT